MGYLIALLISIAGIIGAVQTIVGVKDWLVARKRCEFIFHETGVRCHEKSVKGGVYCSIHLAERIRARAVRKDNSNGSRNEVS